MTIEATVRALADLSEIDSRLSSTEAPKGLARRALETLRAELREIIPATFVSAYDALGRARVRPAVVPLVRGAHCGGCHIRIPPQLGASIRRGLSVCSCPHCRRLLYFADRPRESEGGNDSNDRLPRKDRARSRRSSRAAQ
jgi:predicted  nucleic acid-binding Zn-ribbon protein